MPTNTLTELLQFILTLDPLVGDTACQLRAMFLVHLYHQAEQQANQQNFSLLEHKSFFDSALLLSNYDLKEEDSIYIPTPKVIKHNNLGKHKKAVASKCVTFASDYQAKHMNFEHYQPASPPYISTSHQKIPLIPCYISTHSMLRFLSNSGYLLLIDMRRLRKEEQKYTFLGAGCIAYRVQDQAVAIPVEQMRAIQYEPGICISMASYIQDEQTCTDKMIEPLFSMPCFTEFLTAFKENINMITLVMMAAAAHPQYPLNSTRFSSPAVSDAMKRDFQVIPEDTNTAEPLEVNLSSDTDLNVCTREQFRGLCRLASRYGLFPKREEDAAINIKHIKISTIKQVEELEDASRKTHAIAPGGAHV